jgi:serine/threonine-protein kinase
MTEPVSREQMALQEAVAGRYSIETEIGRGGMGIVFLARDAALNRPVAIKLLPPVLAALPDSRQRFLQEARTAAGLFHPNIVPIHAVEEQGDLVFYVMGYVQGETLRDLVER